MSMKGAIEKVRGMLTTLAGQIERFDAADTDDRRETIHAEIGETIRGITAELEAVDA